MAIILGLMFAGIIAGHILGKYPAVSRINQKLLNLAIYALLLLLGMGVGSGEQIRINIYNLGFQALIIAFGGIAGSVLLCWVIYKAFFHLR